MPQLHLYVPQNIADEVKRRAESLGLSVSRYLARVVRQEVADEWPEEFFGDVVGQWQGEPLVRPSQLSPEEREKL